MWIASSTSPPGGAAPSATSSGVMFCAAAKAGAHSSARKINNRFSIATPLAVRARLVEVRPKPALRLLQIDSAARCIILELIAADPSDPEILAVAMPEIEARHRRRRQHREILGQLDAAGVLAEHVEQDRLEAVIWAGRVARRRPDPAELLADQIGVRKMLFRIAPQPLPDLGMKHFGEALRQPIRQRLQKNIGIIVMAGLEPLEVRLEPVDADRETADPILAFGVDEIG